MLPKRQQRFLFPLESAIETGTFTLRARVDIGSKEIQEATVQVTPAAIAPNAAPQPPAPVKKAAADAMRQAASGQKQ